MGDPILKFILCYKEHEDSFFNIVIRENSFVNDALHILFTGMEGFKLPSKVIPIQSLVIKLKIDLGYKGFTLFEIRIAESEINNFFDLLERTESVLQKGLELKRSSLNKKVVTQIEDVIAILSENRIP